MIGVLSDAQGKGSASALMNPLLQRMKEKSAPVFLVTENLRNVDIYKKKGFKVFETLTIGDYNLFLMSIESLLEQKKGQKREEVVATIVR
jgi:ribosomal protein S18 acetylase RimI-like enzyme